MIYNNPFTEIAATIPATVMQNFLNVMILMVVAGTIFDVVHKKSAKYFFKSMKDAKKEASRQIGGGEKIKIAAATAAHDVLASGEFCNPRRRIAHLLTMYGFLLFAGSSCVMGLQVCGSRRGNPSRLYAAVAPWSINGLCRWLLVLVLHSCGCFR